MAWHQVEQYFYAAVVCLFHEGHEVFRGAVPRRNLVVVAHVVAGIFEGGIKNRIEPDHGDSQVSEVIQLAGDAGQVPDAVPVGIGKALGINLVEDLGLQVQAGV